MKNDTENGCINGLSRHHVHKSKQKQSEYDPYKESITTDETAAQESATPQFLADARSYSNAKNRYPPRPSRSRINHILKHCCRLFCCRYESAYDNFQCRNQHQISW